jgi:hypothetical protein
LQNEVADRALAVRQEGRRLTFETGPCAFVRVFVTVDGRLLAADGLVLRQLDAAGRVLAEESVADLGFGAVGTATDPLAGLPSEWSATASPWRPQVEPVAQLFAQPEALALAGLVRGVFKVTPAADELEVQRDEIATVQSFLGDESVSAIFAPDTVYTVSVRYDAESQAADGSTSTEAGLVQRFRFATDAAAPARLDPWVLATTPAAEERYHFWGEPVRLVLNDLSVPALWAAYGQRLRANLRGADGLPVPGTGAPFVPEAVPGTFGSAYRDTLAELADAGLLPCVGTASAVQHGRFTLPVELQPLLPYTLDVEAVASDGTALPVPEGVRTPLFRRAFTTSRYRGRGRPARAAARAAGPALLVEAGRGNPLPAGGAPARQPRAALARARRAPARDRARPGRPGLPARRGHPGERSRGARGRAGGARPGLCAHPAHDRRPSHALRVRGRAGLASSDRPSPPPQCERASRPRRGGHPGSPLRPRAAGAVGE